MNSTIRIRAAVFAGALALTLPFNAAAQKPKSSDTPVTSSISSDQGLQIQSDGNDDYTNSSTLKSVIASNGEWTLDSIFVSGSTRTVYLEFDQPIAGTGPNGGNPVSPPSGLYKAKVSSQCWRAPYSRSFLTLAPGDDMPCPMFVRFDTADGRAYYLHMSQSNPNFPQTDDVTVTCISGQPGPCSQWRIAPSTTNGSNIANLSYMETVRGKTVYVNQGDFYVAFSIIVSKP